MLLGILVGSGVRVVSENLRSVVGSFYCSVYSAYLWAKQRADERTRTADLLITSLLALVLACPSASGFRLAYAGFGGSGRRSVYCVLVRIREGCSTVAVHLYASRPAAPSRWEGDSESSEWQ